MLRVFKKVLMRVFCLRRDEVTGEWRRRSNEEFYALYSSQNIIRVIKSRKIRWVSGEVHARFWWINLREEDHLEDTGVNES
jgi:hypothetical protein